MRFSYDNTNVGLKMAIEFCDSLAENSDFWDKIAQQGTFDFTEVSAQQISQTLRSCPNIVDVLHWYPGFVRSNGLYRRTTAITKFKQPYTILYHTRFLSNSVAQKVNTLAHEFVHNVDYHADGSNRIDYGHGDQVSVGKGNSAPYAIGKIAENFYIDSLTSNNKKTFDINESYDFDCYIEEGEAPNEEILHSERFV